MIVRETAYYRGLGSQAVRTHRLGAKPGRHARTGVQLAIALFILLCGCEYTALMLETYGPAALTATASFTEQVLGALLVLNALYLAFAVTVWLVSSGKGRIRRLADRSGSRS